MRVESTLGQRLRERRVQLGYTQRDVARACGFAETYLSRYELDRTMPSARSLYLLARMYRVSMETLLVGGSTARLDSPAPGLRDATWAADRRPRAGG